MAWFIIQRDRTTWTKFIVEADDEKSAIEAENCQYLGYVDGDDTDSAIVGGRFKSKEEALNHVVSYVEG